MKITNKKSCRILFVIPSYAIGGVTSSLYALIKNLEPSRAEVDLFCRHHVGPMKQVFEQCCHVLPESVWLSLFMVESGVFSAFLCNVMGFMRMLLRKIGVNINPLYNRIGGQQLHIDKYDAVISFHEGLSSIVSTYPAKRRIAWIHCDYGRQREMVNKDEEKEYECFDRIVCVSEYAKNVFNKIYPSLAERTIAIHNIIDIENIKAQSLKSDDFDEKFDTSDYTIISMGRLDPVKQFALIPKIAAQIKQLTTSPFKWYILGGSRGFTHEEEKIRMAIQRYGVSQDIILLGEKSNVYPYLAKANMYVCTSKSESYPLAVNEAKVLGIPVVSNSFPSATESIVNGKDGYITEMDNMAKVIVDLMECPLQVERHNPPKLDVLEAFYHLIEDKY